MRPILPPLLAADVYVGLITERATARPSHPTTPPPSYVASPRRMYWNHVPRRPCWAPPVTVTQRTADHAVRATPVGYQSREVEVLNLAAKGFTTRQIAERLFISPKTADHHIQHVYTKDRRVDARGGGTVGDAERDGVLRA